MWACPLCSKRIAVKNIQTQGAVRKAAPFSCVFIPSVLQSTQSRIISHTKAQAVHFWAIFRERKMYAYLMKSRSHAFKFQYYNKSRTAQWDRCMLGVSV